MNLRRNEFFVESFELEFARRHAVLRDPCGADARNGKNSVDVILLRDAHGLARLSRRDGNAHAGEQTFKRRHWSAASKVGDGARPIENNGLNLHNPIRLSVRSASPKESVMPEPPSPEMMRIPGAGSASKHDFSGCVL